MTTHSFIASTAVIFFSIISWCRRAASFSQIHTPFRNPPPSSRGPPQSPSAILQYTHIYSTIILSAHAPSTADSGGIDIEEEQHNSYPVQIHHQGHVATIFVRENEPILQALERQSTIPNNSNDRDSSLEGQAIEGGKSLSLSHIPHDCRRGNCLTCSSRIKTKSNTQNIVVNVNNGLSPTVDSELIKSGYILTCCSFITGPGVALELDKNDQVWDMIYRKRMCNNDTKKIALEAQARLLRRVSEENVGKWKRRMEENWDSRDALE